MHPKVHSSTIYNCQARYPSIDEWIKMYTHTQASLVYHSAGKKSACNAGDPGSIPGLGRSPGEGVGYPLQYSWASLVTQIIKNPPEIRETWVWSLSWKDPLEEGMATHSSILAWWIPMDRGAWQRVRHGWETKHSTASHCMNIIQLICLFNCWWTFRLFPEMCFKISKHVGIIIINH